MVHCGTIFSQMLEIIPRHVFGTLDKAHGTGRAARKFSRWDQFVHLVAIQLTGRVSLRDGVRSMRSRINNFYHLGAKPAARSTFAEANEKRPGRPATGRLPGQGDRQTLRLFDQPLRPLRQDHRRHLQRTLADRGLLPLHQAEPEDALSKNSLNRQYQRMILHIKTAS